MIDGLKPYPAMKDSVVPWLGEVPDHWEVRRLKHATKRIVGGSTPSSSEAAYWDGAVVWITPSDVSKTSHLKSSQRRITNVGLSACSAELVPPGSIVVTSRAPVGNVAIADVELSTNQGCKALVPAVGLLNPVFAFHVLTTLRGELQSLATGTTFTEISSSRIGDVRAPLPPLPEQAAIVHFLDLADRRIRRYIRAKQRLIELLEEQVAARVSEAMRHPACITLRLGWVADEHIRPIVVDVAETYIALGLYNRGRGIFHKRPTLGAELGDSTFSWVEPDDLVISGQFAWEGAVALASAAEERTIVSHRYYMLRGVTDRLTTPYLWALLRSDFGAMLLDQHSRGAAGRNRPLNMRTLMKEPIPVPPFEMQQSIDELLVSTAPLRAQAARAISMCREYRTRLIADVVTGKLDVREAAARLPDEGEEPEPLDESKAESEPDESGADDSNEVPEEAEA